MSWWPIPSLYASIASAFIRDAEPLKEEMAKSSTDAVCRPDQRKQGTEALMEEQPKMNIQDPLLDSVAVEVPRDYGLLPSQSTAKPSKGIVVCAPATSAPGGAELERPRRPSKQIVVSKADRCMGPREPLASLAHEFRFNKSFVEKVDGLLKNGYVGWRKIRGDGNCCYRAVGFGLLEQIVAAPAALQQAWAEDLINRLQLVNYKDEKEASDHLKLLQQLRRLRTGESWPKDPDDPEAPGLELLYRSLSSPHFCYDLAFIRAMRFLTAKYLTENADNDEAGGGISFNLVCMAQERLGGVEQFIQEIVAPIGKEAEDLVLTALPRALGVDMRIALLDRNASTTLTFMDYNAEGNAGEPALAKPRVHVQLRPGHYDLLYTKEDDQALSDALTGRPPTFGGNDGASQWANECLGQPEEKARRFPTELIGQLPPRKAAVKASEAKSEAQAASSGSAAARHRKPREFVLSGWCL